jgi:hypothetical protein
LFAGGFGVSLIFAVLQIMPEKSKMLSEPIVYYRKVKFTYERRNLSVTEIDLLIKAAYIGELERNIEKKSFKLLLKNTFYNIAFYFATLACIPYLYCVWRYINLEKNDKKQSKFVSISVVLPKPIICGEENQNIRQLMPGK